MHEVIVSLSLSPCQYSTQPSPIRYGKRDDFFTCYWGCTWNVVMYNQVACPEPSRATDNHMSLSLREG
jgi:hypothetical protein